jgi:hypothetical protein
MAKRGSKNETPTADINKLVQVFCTLAQFDNSEESPLTVQEISDELGENAFPLLEMLNDAELIEFERGKVWISIPDVSVMNAESVAREGLANFVPETPSKPATKVQNRAPKAVQEARREEQRARLEYAANVAESQDGDMQHATPRVIPATEPVKAAPERLPEIDGLDQFTDAETGDMVYESRISKLGLALDEPESVPPCPQGVNPNVWDLAHSANTQSARDYWTRQVEAVLNAQSDVAPF